jgi:glycosyltransferase involved in cell wall biosynthesis
MPETLPETLIDICMPTYNSKPEYMVQAIESALAQTEKRWRMYLHDDASHTDIESIIKPYLSDPRISWHPNQKKLGIGGNWNATMRLGKAPLVQFLFPDDWWEPHYLERGLKVMNELPDVGLVVFEHEYYCEQGAASIPLYKDLEEYRRKHLEPGHHNGMETVRFWLERELHPNIIGEPDFVMLRRSLMEEVGPYLEDMPQNLDMEYSLRCLVRTNWYHVKENCGYFRVHDDATSAVNQREGKGVFDRFRCFETVINLLPGGPDKQLAIAARNRALTDMAKKFLNRVSSGKQVKAKGGGAFKTFALQHPFLVLGALWRAWRTK